MSEEQVLSKQLPLLSDVVVIETIFLDVQYKVPLIRTIGNTHIVHLVSCSDPLHNRAGINAATLPIDRGYTVMLLGVPLAHPLLPSAACNGDPVGPEIQIGHRVIIPCFSSSCRCSLHSIPKLWMPKP